MSTSSFRVTISLPDVNVWIALTAEGHVHHVPARGWFAAQPDTSVAFCRITQMGLLRLIDESARHGRVPENRRSSVGNFRETARRSAACLCDRAGRCGFHLAAVDGAAQCRTEFLDGCV